MRIGGACRQSQASATKTATSASAQTATPTASVPGGLTALKSMRGGGARSVAGEMGCQLADGHSVAARHCTRSRSHHAGTR